MVENKHGGSSERGFGSMDPDKQRSIASKGGSSVPGEERSFSKDHELAAEAGRKGGQHSHGGSAEGDHGGKPGGEQGGKGGGNFADDRERAAEAGRKGGHASHGGRS
jgi:general stress protein YciG